MLKEDRHGSVCVIAIDRPRRRNALDHATVAAMRVRFAALDSDPSVAAIVLTGSEPGFCAGSDLKELATLDTDGMAEHEAETAAFARGLSFLSKPVVAAVAGFALGGGFILAASCDVVVSEPSTRWHLPEVLNGWIPPWGLTVLAARCGPVAARRLTWGARPIDGTEALRVGVADVVAEGALGAAIAEAEALAQLPAAAVASTKRYFARQIMGSGEADDMEANRLFVEDCRSAAATATFQRFGMRA
ncbi:enoyl-CoA hydratase/isomerase family protein [Xanthobacter sp. KR7-65]|uniref:enoyl-CoA hydratase/isomerase family protein n=1 Tax=Xanthobacter sp. KR7-65 TaxID=3156612 RepID=UPI0032B3320A